MARSADRDEQSVLPRRDPPARLTPARLTPLAKSGNCQIWQEARQANDFAAFQLWLEKIIHLKRQEAAAVGYQQVPYDALLDEFEPGASTAEVTRVFADLRKYEFGDALRRINWRASA